MTTSINSFGFVPFKTIEDETISNTTNLKREELPEDRTQPHMTIHRDIKSRLRAFYDSKKIPHIIFHGVSGSGKLTIVNEFIHMIYNFDKAKIKANVMIVNCSHGKGIKFIREEIKFFAKTNIQTHSGIVFKTIILLNAHHLTEDAQSALRRCIEQFSYNTRFFIVVENKNKLLNPILSRFCDIYVPEHIEEGVAINLHQYAMKQHMSVDAFKEKNQQILTQLVDLSSPKTSKKLAELAHQLYERGVSCIDLIDWLPNSNAALCYHKIKTEYRCEKMLMFYILNYVYNNDTNMPNT